MFIYILLQTQEQTQNLIRIFRVVPGSHSILVASLNRKRVEMEALWESLTKDMFPISVYLKTHSWCVYHTYFPPASFRTSPMG